MGKELKNIRKLGIKKTLIYRVRLKDKSNAWVFLIPRGKKVDLEIVWGNKSLCFDLNEEQTNRMINALIFAKWVSGWK